MELTRENLDTFILSARCCSASLAIKLANRYKKGSKVACMEDDLLLLQRYLEILCGYTLTGETCDCSILGSWELVSTEVGNGTVYFYPDGGLRFYTDSTTFVNGFWQLNNEALYFVLEDASGPLEFTLYPIDGNSLFSDDCQTLTGYSSEVDAGTVAETSTVTITSKYFNPYVVFAGDVIYTPSWPYSLRADGVENNLQEFINAFNAENIGNITMNYISPTQFTVTAPAVGTAYNGLEFQMFMEGNLTPFVNTTFSGGVNPVDAEFTFTLAESDSQAQECCSLSNNLTEAQLKDIINHVSKLCSIYKCC